MQEYAQDFLLVGVGVGEQGAGKGVPVWPKTSFDNTRYLFSINFSIC